MTMNTDNPLPFKPGPLDFSQPVEFRFSQWLDVQAAAGRAGFQMIRLDVAKGGKYRAHFERITPPEPPRQGLLSLTRDRDQSRLYGQPEGNPAALAHGASQ